MGVIEDVTRRTPVGFAAEGDAVYLLGETRDELDGSAWADVVHDHLGGRPPQVDLAHEQRLAGVLVQAQPAAVCSAAPTTCPTAASRRPWSSRACAATTASR